MSAPISGFATPYSSPFFEDFDSHRSKVFDMEELYRLLENCPDIALRQLADDLECLLKALALEEKTQEKCEHLCHDFMVLSLEKALIGKSADYLPLWLKLSTFFEGRGIELVSCRLNWLKALVLVYHHIDSLDKSETESMMKDLKSIAANLQINKTWDHALDQMIALKMENFEGSAESIVDFLEEVAEIRCFQEREDGRQPGSLNIYIRHLSRVAAFHAKSPALRLDILKNAYDSYRSTEMIDEEVLKINDLLNMPDNSLRGVIDSVLQVLNGSFLSISEKVPLLVTLFQQFKKAETVSWVDLVKMQCLIEAHFKDFNWADFWVEHTDLQPWMVKVNVEKKASDGTRLKRDNFSLEPDRMTSLGRAFVSLSDGKDDEIAGRYWKGGQPSLSLTILNRRIFSFEDAIFAEKVLRLFEGLRQAAACRLKA